jgi:glycosyltransferase involved in cell wall biosynthesis
VLSVGVVAPHKGLHRLLEVAAALPAGTIEVQAAGWLDRAPAYVQAIRERVARADLAGVVRLHGALDRPELEALFRAAQVLALPSDRESYPLAGLEGLGHGLPLLITDQGGTAELIGPGGAGGVALDPDDRQAWVAQLARWHADRAQLAAAARSARARYLEHGPWIETARVVQGFLRQVAGGVGAG